MTHPSRALACAWALALAAPATLAQEIFVYPAQGQSVEQQEKDKFECYKWAKEQTGFDPMQRPDVAAAPTLSSPETGGAVRGAARGAAVGAVGAAIAGDAGKGAGVGAAAGALRERQAEREHEARQEAAEQQVKQAYAQDRESWERAAKTCLQGCGYTANWTRLRERGSGR